MSVLPDILEPGLDIVFCGSAAGRVSAQAGAYYAGPGNRFWPTLHAVGLTPERLEPHRFREVPRWGLGLTDLCKTASGGDADLPAGADDVQSLRDKLLYFRPSVVAFVGKRPAAAFLGRAVETGLQQETVAGTSVFVLPSPSGAARRWWSVEPWRELAGRFGSQAAGRASG